MNRKEWVREYWDQRIPASPSFYLVDVARYTEGVVSLRTLQRRASEGSLPAQGGSDRAVGGYRVLREDLIEFLCGLDVITGVEPPEPRPRPLRRREVRAQRKGKGGGRLAGEVREGKKRYEQIKLFD